MTLEEQLGSWWPLLKEEFAKPYMFTLSNNLLPSIRNSTIQPPKEMIFRAFKLCPADKMKILIMGQDPYPGGEADGLAFSSRNGRIPKSLDYIFKELCAEGYGTRKNPDLSDWAEQGVLLLNTCLSTEFKSTLAHETVGWHKFIRAVLKVVNGLEQAMICMAWGRPAQDTIDANITTKPILKWYHPNAGRYQERNSFIGCGHFKKANLYLDSHGVAPIIWVPYKYETPRPLSFINHNV